MKRALLFLFLLPFFGFSQTTRVSTQNGNFLNPLIWSPIGLPASGDSIVIDHNVVMNSNIYYTSGIIYIRPGGQLIEDATERTFWADGSGAVKNEGTFTAHLLLISPNAKFTNSGNFINIDSLWNQGTVINTNSGTAGLNDFWNDQTGVFTNDGILSNADSLFNQGTFTNNVNAMVYDVLNDQMGTFTNTGHLEVQNNMNNQGDATNQATMVVYNDFSNCNIQSADAIFNNSGQFCIGNDFINCAGDSLLGSGSYYVGGVSTNLGVFEETFTFYTPSGTVGIPGTIGSNVTVAAGTCNLGLSSPTKTWIVIYPNPFTDLLNISEEGAAYQITDVYGRVKLSGTVKNESIDVSQLESGIYVIQIKDYEAKRIIKL